MREHSGLVVYRWDALGQDLVLTEGLAPELARLRRDGVLQRFWFDRFDTRGPHVFAVLTGPPSAIEARLSPPLEACLARLPASGVDRAELEKRHGECRGKTQCAVDELPGFGAEGTFAWCPHPERGYPFGLGEGMENEERLWGHLDRLASWSLEQLARRPGRPAAGAALAWLAALDRDLARAHSGRAEAWRHHASTLLPALSRRLEEEGDEQVLNELPGWVSAANRRQFDRFWSQPGDGGWPPVGELVEMAVEDACRRPPERRWRLLREVVHITFKQLGLPVAQHVPAILYAWSGAEA